MKKNGFTLVELLICVALLGFVLLVGIISARNALSTSLIRVKNISDNEIFNAARSYVIGEDISLKKGYTCVYVKDLIDYGYLNDFDNVEKKDKLIKVSRNNITKVINKIKYVDVCE